MKKILLSILLAIVATGANAQFKASINMKPDKDETPRYIRFNFADVCRQLGTDCDTFASEMKTTGDVNKKLRLYLLTDTGGEWNGSGFLSLDGKMVEEWDEIKWICDINLNGTKTNIVEFTISKWINPFTQQLTVVEGDICHALWALEYNGGIATFDITVNISEEKEPDIPLSDLEKIGEEVISVKFNDYRDRLLVETDLKRIAELFGDNVKWRNLELCAMTDARQQLLRNFSTYDITNVYLNIDGTICENLGNGNWFDLGIFSDRQLTIGTSKAGMLAGQTTSGSVFLISDGKYYELIMNIQFDNLYDDLVKLDVVEDEVLNVQLMKTDNFFTFFDREKERYALISTEIEEEHIRAVLATDNPVLFTEKKDTDGHILFTRRYNAAPGQGFWFTVEDGLCYYSDSYQLDTPLGMYYTDGSFKWYEGLDFAVRTGDSYQVNLYLVNPENGKAVKYEISVEIVKELQTESVAYVRSLPVGMGTPDGIERPTPSPSLGKGAIYDLQGRRLLKAPEKGLYIQGGVLRMK